MNARALNLTLSETELTRFWSKVDKAGDCWVWTASLVTGGYGCVTLRSKTFTTHRISYLIHNGPIPEGVCVLHKCDNRRCVNPDHFFTGSKGDNNTDTARKQRFHQLFTPEDIPIIRNTPGIKPIAKALGVDPGTIRAIKARITYDWVR